MEKKLDLERIYFYASSLVLLIVLVVLTITLIGNLVNYFIPSTAIYNQDEFAIREQIVRSKYGPEISNKELKEKMSKVTDREVREFLQKQINQERAQILKNILSQVLSLVFVIPLYLFHYRMARKLR
jgi:predicted PurR-regulated permease PerM